METLIVLLIAGLVVLATGLADKIAKKFKQKKRGATIRKSAFHPLYGTTKGNR